MSRVAAALLLALQALLWIGGPIVDGRNEASSARTQTHVEELGGTKCPRAHSHLDCLICRTLVEGAVTTSPQPLIPTRGAGGVELYQTAALAVRDATDGALGSRAPPLA